MANSKPLDSYTIRDPNKFVKVGDCVLLRHSETGMPPHVVQVVKIEADSVNNVNVHVRWYYRPEQAFLGRRPFHGAKELYLSDYYSVLSAETILRKCTVHSFSDYKKLSIVRARDYFYRSEYKHATGEFTPNILKMFHPACVDMTIEEATSLDHFFCSECIKCSSIDTECSGFYI